MQSGERADTMMADTEVSAQGERNVIATDHYEILRIGPHADNETIERIYRTLADRFHPDNPNTGDPETFSRLKDAYETLSDQARRAEYNLVRQDTTAATRFSLRGREFFNCARGAQNRRMAVLCILYRRSIAARDAPGLSILDLEHLTGCTREELTAALWYLCEKGWARIGEFTTYTITVDGFDAVESKAAERLEFRSLATVPYYCAAGELEGDDLSHSDLAERDPLPFNFEPASTSEEEAGLVDHYEILGIAPHADGESIQRVYGTLAARFHPENPATGDEKMFVRIRNAYDTLSDSSRREQYDAQRERSQFSERFRLRGREFFDGIRGEQLRRLAVLCLLYRQAASELPGLTILDLEKLTGCTREELSSAVWYLREKQWAKAGAFTEYRITAAGFDIVEHKLDERDASRAHKFAGEPTRSNEFIYLHQASAAPETTLARNVGINAAGPEDSTCDVPVPLLSSGVSSMSNLQIAIAKPAEFVAVQAEKRVIFSMGGKGGVGKTSVMTSLAEWFEENQIPVKLLDLDTENKAKGSLTHFFGGRIPKINIHTPSGLDMFIDILGEDEPAILADMGAGAGQITHDWFEKMYPDVNAAGVVFTAIGVVTADPASVESVLNWASALQHRVAYIIVENHLTEHTDFTYWRDGEQAQEFRRRFQPVVIRMDNRLADLENPARNHGVTLSRVANRSTHAPELQKASLVMRAQSYRRRMFSEFDRVKELLLP